MARARTASGRLRLLRLLSVLLACGVALALLVAGELLCRALSDITFRGNSRALFVADVWGASKGNARNATNVSFGVEVHTDEFGFRVPSPGHRTSGASEGALLILGDSVGFGAGVEEASTLAGRLRARNPSVELYNSSVIGYFTYDYRNVIEHFPWAERGVDRVVLLFCLNDVSAASAQRIDAHLAGAGSGDDRPAQAVPAPEGGLVGAAKRIGWITRVNELLRTRSKLYVLTISLLADPRPRQWQAVRALYDEDNAEAFRDSMRPVVEIAELLADAGVELEIIVLPFSPQFETSDPAAWLPQRKLAAYFEEHGLDFVDARDDFAAHRRTGDLFLPFDPMHLSEEGHRVVAGIIARRTGMTG